jgi:DNA-binding beta-propeller fold protein YncE
MTTRRWLPLLALLLAPATFAAAPSPGYHVLHSYTLGGDGFWDYLALDTAGHRLFIARQDRVLVVDPGSGRLLAEIHGLERAHGVAFDDRTGHGFATSGSDASVTIFDLKSLAVLGKTPVDADDDAIVFDPATGRVFTFNGDAETASVLDGETGKKLGTIPLGAKPEYGVSAGDGKLYVNLESTSALAEIDAAGMRVTRSWPLAPCENPTGLAIDTVHHRLFSGCRNQLMAISETTSGKLIATVPIGSGVDATRYDPATGLAFASCGDGTMTVIHEDDPDHFQVVASVSTMRGARTMELDPESHEIFTVSAQFGPMPAEPAAGEHRRRPPMIPGTFTLLVLGR